MSFTPIQRRAWKTLEQRWNSLEFNGLSTEEQEVIALFWLEGEVMNGGLDQFFHNSSGDLAILAASGLRRINATISLEILEKTMARFGEGNYPIDRDRRLEILNSLEFDGEPFDSETRVLQDLPERFLEMALDRLVESYTLMQRDRIQPVGRQ